MFVLEFNVVKSVEFQEYKRNNFTEQIPFYYKIPTYLKKIRGLTTRPS